MRATTYSQHWLKPLLSKDKIGVDLTCGNGHDTAFLASGLKRVYAFDIQEVAIVSARKRLSDFNNVSFINDNHAHIKDYIKENVHIAMGNLGYLPDGDKDIITKSDSTIKALNNLYDILVLDGILSLILYRGHKGAMDEYYKVTDYIKRSSYKIIDTYQSYKDPFEPILYILTKWLPTKKTALLFEGQCFLYIQSSYGLDRDEEWPHYYGDWGRII